MHSRDLGDAKETPMLFQDRLVQSILDGEKTVTRRLDKDPDKPPRWRPGDTIWVRETHCRTEACHWPDLPHKRHPNGDMFCFYRTGFDRAHPRWRPSIFLPRWASRILLKVERVDRVRLLGSMSDASEFAREGFAAGGFWGAWDQMHPGDASHTMDPMVVRVEFSLAEVSHEVKSART